MEKKFLQISILRDLTSLKYNLTLIGKRTANPNSGNLLMVQEEKLVIHFQNGRILKGTSQDFSPRKNTFHLNLINGSSTNHSVKILLEEVKGVFFVKDFVGNKEYQEDQRPSNPEKIFYRQRTIVHFKDKEVLYGFTQEYEPGLLGFFLYPYDSQSNNLKLFALHSFVSKVEFPH